LAGAQAAEMRGVRLMENDEGTRAVIDLSGPADYKVFTLHNPERMVLDLRGANLDGAYDRPPVNGMVTDVRTGRPTPETLRVVFDLGTSVTTQSRIEGSGAQPRPANELPQAGAPGKPETRPPEHPGQPIGRAGKTDAPGSRARSKPGLKDKAAFTLRLDGERHLKLRLACAVRHQSAQNLVTDALDAFLDSMPEIGHLASHVPTKKH